MVVPSCSVPWHSQRPDSPQAIGARLPATARSPRARCASAASEPDIEVRPLERYDALIA